MSTIKFTLKPTPNGDGKQSIIIQIIKDRKNTSISLGKSVKLEDWSFETQRVKSQNRQHKALNNFINKYQDLLEQQIDDLELRGAEYSIADLVKIVKSGFSSKKLSLSYTDYQQAIIDNNKDTAQSSTNVFFRDSLSSMKRCLGKGDINFYEIKIGRASCRERVWE